MYFDLLGVTWKGLYTLLRYVCEHLGALNESVGTGSSFNW